ncbi:MAG: DUF2946 family protein [Roseiarcus sp.]
MVRSVFVVWIAILALVGQLASAVQPDAMASPAQAEAAAALSALSALLGPNVEFCHRDDGSPTKGSHSCCDDCALCQHNAHAAALASPGVFLPVRFARCAGPSGFSDETSLARPRLVASAQPRAPPVPV